MASQRAGQFVRLQRFVSLRNCAFDRFSLQVEPAMRVFRKVVVIGLVVAISIRTTPIPADACCPAFRAGRDVQIADQRILVAWDPHTKMEHFVREAGFRVSDDRSDATSAEDGNAEARNEDFGFLVPSPTSPEVEESDRDVFLRLESQVRPIIQRVNRWRVDFTPGLLRPFKLEKTLLGKGGLPPNVATDVRVLETKQVAGYDVAILQADDAGALQVWLKDHGYAMRDSMKDWVQPYIEKGWVITAFKYAEGSTRTNVEAVRMSFRTDRPVFPYRVPSDQHVDLKNGRGNTLRAYVVGPGKAEGHLGEGANASPWASKSAVRYSKPLAKGSLLGLLRGAIAQDDFEEPMWLTAIDDHTWPSGSDDLWFDFDPKGTEYQQINTVMVPRTVPIPLDLVALFCVSYLAIRRRRKSSSV